MFKSTEIAYTQRFIKIFITIGYIKIERKTFWNTIFYSELIQVDETVLEIIQSCDYATNVINITLF